MSDFQLNLDPKLSHILQDALICPPEVDAGDKLVVSMMPPELFNVKTHVDNHAPAYFSCKSYWTSATGTIWADKLQKRDPSKYQALKAIFGNDPRLSIFIPVLECPVKDATKLNLDEDALKEAQDSAFKIRFLAASEDDLKTLMTLPDADEEESSTHLLLRKNVQVHSLPKTADMPYECTFSPIHKSNTVIRILEGEFGVAAKEAFGKALKDAITRLNVLLGREDVDLEEVRRGKAEDDDKPASSSS